MSLRSLSFSVVVLLFSVCVFCWPLVHHCAIQCVFFEAITEDAHKYLTEWVKGTRPRIPRPDYYSFLNHCHFAQPTAQQRATVPDDPFRRAEPRPVRVLQQDGHQICPDVAELHTNKHKHYCIQPQAQVQPDLFSC